MTGNSPVKFQDNVEPIQADTIGAIANISNFNTLAGCGATYSVSNMQITIAAGAITHTSAYTAVAGNVVTLVSDPSNPRWTYQYVNSSGVAAIVSGSPAAIPSVPDFGENVTGQLVYVQAGLTVAASAQYKLNHQMFAQSTLAIGGLVQKYKSAVQTFSTNTSFADVVAAGSPATMSFAIGANEVWQAEYWIPLTFGGTGGAKFQLTGPSAPTAVAINGTYGNAAVTGGDPGGVLEFPTVTAFSTTINGVNSAASVTSPVGAYVASGGAITGTAILIRAVIINGANAGTVTLQAAQNSSNSTTTLGIGSYMRAMRMA